VEGAFNKNVFIYLAQHYLFPPIVSDFKTQEPTSAPNVSGNFDIPIATSFSIEEVCIHNSKVARDIGEHQIAHVWQIIQQLYGSGDSFIIDNEFYPRTNNLNVTSNNEIAGSPRSISPTDFSRDATPLDPSAISSPITTPGVISPRTPRNRFHNLLTPLNIPDEDEVVDEEVNDGPDKEVQQILQPEPFVLIEEFGTKLPGFSQTNSPIPSPVSNAVL